MSERRLSTFSIQRKLQWSRLTAHFQRLQRQSTTTSLSMSATCPSTPMSWKLRRRSGKRCITARPLRTMLGLYCWPVQVGDPTILINNAGVVVGKPLLELSEKEITK